MGLLDGIIKVNNQTPYKWTTCLEVQMPLWLPYQRSHNLLSAYESSNGKFIIPITMWKTIYMKVKYGYCSERECCEHPDLWYIFNPKDDPTFIIRESGDRSEIHLEINRSYTKKKSTCPNYGKDEDDSRQREEEQRRERERQQAQRELERRIEEQIKRESEISAQRLSLANQNLKQKQLLRGQESRQVQIVQKPMETYEIDEAAGVEQKFTELMSIYNITENEDSLEKEESLAERMNCLQNEILVAYCKKHHLSSSCLFFFDSAVGSDTLCLSDRLTVLEAVLYVAEEEESEDAGTRHTDKDFLLLVLKQLHDTHPSLAWKLLQNYLYTDVDLSVQSKEILCQMVFSNMWTPAETLEFLQNSSGKEQVYTVLHMAQTYKLQYRTVISALQEPEPLRCLQRHVSSEKHKDAKSILKEMRDASIPENVLAVLEDVLLHLEKELPKYATANLGQPCDGLMPCPGGIPASRLKIPGRLQTNRHPDQEKVDKMDGRLDDLSEEDILDLKMKIKSLDFRNPDREVLKRVLIGLSVAIKFCSTINIKSDEKTIQTIEGYLPRLTQLAALLIFLLPTSETNTGCLLEIGTGEGKSCILAMLAVIHAIRGEKVDLVTSSPVLACRDLEEWRKLYNMFGITSSVVPPPFNDAPPEKQEQLIQDAYEQQVVYSTVGTFAADTLRQEFEKKVTRGERGFDLVLVDEVDYMTLDNGVQITFLSHESSGLQHLEQVFASIWAITSACRPIQIAETGEIMWTTRAQNFHMAALLAMIGSETSDQFSPLEILLPGIDLGFYSEEDFEMLKASISADEEEKEHTSLQDDSLNTIMAKTGVEQQYDLLSVLEIAMENKVAFNCFEYQSETRKAVPIGEKKTKTDLNINMLLLENGKACEIMPEKLLVEATVKELKSRIKYSCSKGDLEEKTLMVPSSLETYLEKQFPVFVENGLKAIQMTKGREYMIERSLTAQGMDIVDEEQHMYHSVIPLDFQASGILEKQKRWGDGLQQFLEMKHQLALSALTNVTNYMSNLSVFKRYLSGKGIFGVSGTLGGDADTSFLERHYRTDSYVIPAHQHKKVTELPAVQVQGGRDQWIQRLCDTVSKVSDRGQVVLVVCEDVNTANALSEKITASVAHEVTLYTMSESHSIENKEFTEGEIIITTNLGGRGTDIKVTKDVNYRGGLFVILTYFPNNRRVEQQVFGRTGRKGTPGMVQLILDHDHLAQAYQGNSIEVMRELREEYEINRIMDMEKERLVEIEMKEELFSTFCQFLSDFEEHYSPGEKTDLFEVEVKDVPCYFENCCTKMDYHPALDALKEFWGVWLVLHTDQINTQSDIGELKEHLIQHLQNTSANLLQGNSANFYDHIQQAVGRTALHFQNKKCDYGAKSYWEKVSESDNSYRAVALYNQAYITINMARKDYKKEACTLLKEAEKAIDVYVSETTNTLGLVSMSVSGDFEPHHSGGGNVQTQLQARMSIFSAWKKNITKVLSMLNESGDGGVTTVDSSLYSLLSHENFVSASELSLFRNYGLAVVFEVKQKPRFSFDALICCFLGVAQVVAGVLVCALSAGSLSSFGLGLISEGVSDMISGVMGMINGTFSWASWAISKAISIGISLVFGGLRAIKRSYSSVKEASRGILNGTKSLRGVASSAVKSGKKQFVSLCKSVKSVASSMNTKTLNSLCTSNVIKCTFKNAGKYAVQEIAIQGVNMAVNKCIDATVQTALKRAFQQKFKDSVSSALKKNQNFVNSLRKFIYATVPKTALEVRPGDYKIDQDLEMKIKDNVTMKMNMIMSNLLSNCQEVHQIVNTLSRVWDRAVQEFPKHISHSAHKYIKGLLTTTGYCTQIYELYSSIPTETTINSNFVPAFLKTMSEESSVKTWDEDEKPTLEDVERLTCELTDFLSEGVSQAMIDQFSGTATSVFTATFSQKLNSVTGTVVGNLLRRHETQGFFDNQQHYYNVKSAKERTEESLSETERNQTKAYAAKIADEQSQATALELHVLTQSNLLEGKGICVTVVDAQGKCLTEEIYPGADKEAGTIKLVLTKTQQEPQETEGFLNKLKGRLIGKTIPHSGHFDIIRPDGSREMVHSESQDCLFHAVIQATTNGDPDFVKQKATELRSKVGEEIRSKPGKYVKAVKIQTMFNATDRHSKFKIEGGGRSPEKINLYKETIKNLTQEGIIEGYQLGNVGVHEELLGKEKRSQGITEADHIPPKSTFTEAFDQLRKDKMKAAELKRKNEKLYDLIMNTKNDQNGKQQLCMNVLCFDHICALSSGNSRESRACRSLVSEALTNGDIEQAMKCSLIMAHPQSSDNIRNQLEIHRNSKPKNSGLSVESRNQYYQTGFRDMVIAYKEKGIIDQNQTTRLLKWVEENKYVNNNTPEYKDLIAKIEKAKHK